MRFLTDKISHILPEWNVRPLTESDFHRLCRRFRIRVVEMPLTVGGFCYRMGGRDFIAINSRLRPHAKLAVMFHELGHFLFHAPETGATANFHGVGRRTRKECEADVFALCALVPRERIISCSPQDLIDEGISPQTLAERIAVYKRFGL